MAMHSMNMAVANLRSPILTANVNSSCKNPCFKYAESTYIKQPPNLFSSYEYLDVHVNFQANKDDAGRDLFCYMTDNGLQSPTMRVKQGEHLVFTLTNNYVNPNTVSIHTNMTGVNTTMMCGGKKVTVSSTNIHFHGAHTEPVCHGDEVVETIVNSGETFTYDIHFPPSQPPGLFWYHPHVHGFSDDAVKGGATGAVVVEGIENYVPAVGGLPEQIFVFRELTIPTGSIPTNATNVPANDIRVNDIPIYYPHYNPALLEIKPNQKQFWRVLNSGSSMVLNLQLQFDGVVQPLELVSLDGSAVNSQDATQMGKTITKQNIVIPPAGRAEFIITGPSCKVKEAILYTLKVETGFFGENDPTRPVIKLLPLKDAKDPEVIIPMPSKQIVALSPLEELYKKTPTKTRELYFSFAFTNGIEFYITSKGATPEAFSMRSRPAIVTSQDEVEDWVIENQSAELHHFHIHQMHFLLLEINGTAVSAEQMQYRDTVVVPAWSGSGPYPSVKIRIDFSLVPAGSFVYHCHILFHEDNGMMAIIKVLPKSNSGLTTSTSSSSSSSNHGILNQISTGSFVGDVVTIIVVGVLLLVGVTYASILCARKQHEKLEKKEKASQLSDDLESISLDRNIQFSLGDNVEKAPPSNLRANVQPPSLVNLYTPCENLPQYV